MDTRGVGELFLGSEVECHHAFFGLTMASFADFSSQFQEHIEDLVELDTFEPSAARLRKLLKAMILKQTDLEEHPARFYAAHRYLSKYGHKIGPGFSIRFTVQFNLFAGTRAR